MKKVFRCTICSRSPICATKVIASSQNASQRHEQCRKPSKIWISCNSAWQLCQRNWTLNSSSSFKSSHCVHINRPLIGTIWGNKLSLIVWSNANYFHITTVRIVSGRGIVPPCKRGLVTDSKWAWLRSWSIANAPPSEVKINFRQRGILLSGGRWRWFVISTNNH